MRVLAVNGGKLTKQEEDLGLLIDPSKIGARGGGLHINQESRENRDFTRRLFRAGDSMRYTEEVVAQLDNDIVKLQQKLSESPSVNGNREIALAFIKENINAGESTLFRGSLESPDDPNGLDVDYTRPEVTPGIEYIGKDAHDSLFMILNCLSLLWYDANTTRKADKLTRDTLGYCADYIELRGIKVGTRTDTKTESHLTEAQRRILAVIEEAGHRMTTTQVLSALDLKHGPVSVGVTKQHLAELVRRDLLTNRQDVAPKGYGLPDSD